MVLSLKSNHFNLTICAVFVVYIGGFFAVNAVTPPKEFSENENRYLAQKPEFSADALFGGNFTKGYETYITDQFIFRDGWVSMKSYLEKLTGKRENNGIYIGEGGTLLKRFETPNGKRVEANAKAVEDFAQKVSVPVYFSLIPTSTEIWAEKLPKNAPSTDEAALIHSIRQYLTKTHYVDSYSELKAHKSEYIYYRTDHHWTTLGAYYGYAAQARQMGLVPKPLDEFTPDTVTRDFYGTYFSTSGVRYVSPDEIQKFGPKQCKVEILGQGKGTEGKLYDESFLTKKDKYGYFLGGNQALVRLITGNTGKKLLIVRDSYANAQMPFWISHFSEIYVADLRYTKLSMADYVKKKGIDEVLVQYSTANFAEDTNLIFLNK